MLSIDLTGKVAIVTGAGHGSGAAIARALAAAGAHVAVNDMNPDRAHRVATGIREDGGSAIDVTADVSNRFQCVNLIETTRTEWGRIDILVNYASITPRVSVLKMDEWELMRCVDVNFKSAFFMCQLVGRVMADQNQAGDSGGLPTPVIAEPPSGTIPPEAPSDAASSEQVTHVVQAGETLNVISQRYDVSIDDIMLVNGIDNPNFIAVGQALTIPVGGIPEPTAVPTETMVAVPSPIPTEPAVVGAGGGQIGVTGVLDPGLLETEAVQLVNSGATEQSLQGWKVRDEDSNVYTFGDVSIFGEGAGVFLYTRAGQDTYSELHWGLAEPAWRSGETLTLWDANEQVIATYVVP